MQLPRWMGYVGDRMDDADFLRAFHKWATIWWATFGIAISVLARNSVIWVVVMSCWANIASHWAAWQGTRAEIQQRDALDSSDPGQLS